jgi:hypothetical protein
VKLQAEDLGLKCSHAWAEKIDGMKVAGKKNFHQRTRRLGAKIMTLYSINFYFMTKDSREVD